MNRRFALTKWIGALVALLLAGLPLSSQACAACYGEPGSPMSRGLTWAVVALAGMVACVLVAVTAFFVHMGRHSSETNESSPSETDKI